MEYFLYKNINWKKYHGMLVPEDPPHIEIKLDKADCDFLLKETGTLMLRWYTNWDCGYNTNWWSVICDDFIELEDLKSKRRNEIKKGLKNCIIKKISKQKLIDDNGYVVYKEAFNEYKTSLKCKTETDFYKSIINLDEDWDIWGVYNLDMKLIAYSQNYVKSNAAEYKIIKIDPRFKRFYPIYTLIYEMNKYYLLNNNILYVNDGVRSISHDTNIQDFLIKKFNFRKAYCKLNIIYRRDIEIIVTILYPFRKLIRLIPLSIARKLYSLLLQEDIAKLNRNE